MKLYKCNYCGRVFGERIPHRCNKVFRKHKHSWTEIDDSDNEYIHKTQKASKWAIFSKEIAELLNKHGYFVGKLESMDIERDNPFNTILAKTKITLHFYNHDV